MAPVRPNVRPNARPADPRFSPGPTRKAAGWSLDHLSGAALGRSHRSADALVKLRAAIDRTRDVLRVPETHRIAIVPGSDTGAVEAAMWCLLGARGVDVFAWENFGRDWVIDAVKQLRLADLRTFEADYGALPDLAQAQPDRDLVFTWNGTTSGVRVPNADFIAADRTGLTICDATSAAFAQTLDWAKLDIVTYSWQKVLGGEAAHGVLIAGPRAIERLESFMPDRPIPKILRLAENKTILPGLFEGSTINTPSMLCVEDYLVALDWAERIGGLDALHARADLNASLVYDWIDRSSWAKPLCRDKALRSNTSACLVFADPSLAADRAAGAERQAAMLALLAEEGVAFDCGAYKTAPPGLRIWTGATVEASDLEALLPWLDWAFEATRADAAANA